MLQEHLLKQGVETLIHYPIAPHHQEAYKELSYQSYPITEAIHNEVVSLPMSPLLSSVEVQSVIDAVNCFKK